MYWGAIAKNGPVSFVRVDERYRQVLYDHLLPYMEQHLRGLTFMQDNASVHTAKIMRSFFYQKGVCLMDWPAKGLI